MNHDCMDCIHFHEWQSDVDKWSSSCDIDKLLNPIGCDRFEEYKETPDRIKPCSCGHSRISIHCSKDGKSYIKCEYCDKQMNIEDPFRYADADELLDKLISSWNAIAESKNCVTDIPEVSGAGGYYYGPDTEWKEVLNKMFELSDMIQDKYKEKTIKNRGYRD